MDTQLFYILAVLQSFLNRKVGCQTTFEQFGAMKGSIIKGVVGIRVALGTGVLYPGNAMVMAGYCLNKCYEIHIPQPKMGQIPKPNRI